MSTLKITRKQAQVLEAIRSRRVKELLYGGAMGSGKSYLIAMMAAGLAGNHPGTSYGVFRKNRSVLERTTLESFFEYFTDAGIERGRDYHFNASKLIITFFHRDPITGKELPPSKVYFLELDGTKDRNYNKVRSLNIACGFIDECNEVEREAWLAVYSRCGRKNTDYFGRKIPQFLMGTCNPDINWVKDDFYTPFVSDTMPEGKLFVQALPSDNPFLDEEYYEGLKRMPMPFQQLYLYGNWDYTDDENSLFRLHIIERSFIGEVAPGDKFMGVDIADVGKDKTVISIIENNILIDMIEFDVDTSSSVPASEQNALKIIEMAQRNDITAQNIGFDSIGVGVGVRDYLKSKGWFCYEFIAGGSSTQHKNLRSEAYWRLSEAFDKGLFKIFNKCPYIPEIRKELLAHAFKRGESTFSVVGKEDIRKILGHSPDKADSLAIAYFMASGKQTKLRRIIF